MFAKIDILCQINHVVRLIDVNALTVIKYRIFFFTAAETIRHKFATNETKRFHNDKSAKK